MESPQLSKIREQNEDDDEELKFDKAGGIKGIVGAADDPKRIVSDFVMSNDDNNSFYSSSSSSSDQS